MSKSKIIYFSAIGLFSIAAEARGENEIVWVKNNNPVMAKAIRNARSTLDGFLKKHKLKPSNIKTYKLKVRLTDSNGVEHFWVQPFRDLGNGKFEGVLANQPRIVRSLKHGQKVKFSRNMISDWGYKLNGIQYGSYTICALFKKMPKKQVDYYKKNHGFRC